MSFEGVADYYAIEVFGQSFCVRSEKSEQEVRTIAAYVDQQMREHAKARKTNTPLRITIMAALEIAEELFAQRQRCRKETRTDGIPSDE